MVNRRRCPDILHSALLARPCQTKKADSNFSFLKCCPVFQKKFSEKLFTCSNSTLEALVNGMKYVQGRQKSQ